MATTIDKVLKTRLTGPAYARALNRTPQTIQTRIKAGDWPPFGGDRKLSIAEALAHVAKLWDEVAELRRRVSEAEAASEPTRLEKDELDRQLAAQRLERETRRNAIERGELIAVSDVSAAMQDVRTAIRNESHVFADELRADLGLSGEAVTVLEKARAKSLVRLRDALLAAADKLDADEHNTGNAPEKGRHYESTE